MSEWKKYYVTRDKKCHRGSKLAVWDGAARPPEFNEMYGEWDSASNFDTVVCEGPYALSMIGGTLNGIRKGQMVRKEIKIDVQVRLWV